MSRRDDIKLPARRKTDPKRKESKTPPQRSTKKESQDLEDNRPMWILSVENPSQFENLQKAIGKASSIDEKSSSDLDIKVQSSVKSMKRFSKHFERNNIGANLKIRQL